jgi:hypothetical protein
VKKKKKNKKKNKKSTSSYRMGYQGEPRDLTQVEVHP